MTVLLNVVTLLLVIIGGINWGLIGAFEFDLVSRIFGVGSFLTRVVFVLVGLSALYQVWRWLKMIGGRSGMR